MPLGIQGSHAEITLLGPAEVEPFCQQLKSEGTDN